MARAARRHSRAGGTRPGIASIVRATILVLLGAFLALVSLRSSLAEIFQSSRPARALAWQPAHAGASANLAQQLLAADRASDGRQLAERAIARSPLSVSAYSALGLAAEQAGQARQAMRLMAVAESLSRRDRMAQVWMVRQAIRIGDFEGAARHFDIAMRASPRRSSDLLPLLVAATADPRLIAPLNRRLDADPDWQSTFLMSLAAAGPQLDHVVRLSRGRLDPATPEGWESYTRLIRRLVQAQRLDLAWSVYREARPGTAETAAMGLRDPEYGGASGFPPFDWQLSDQPDLMAVRETRRDGGSGVALSLIAGEGRAGEVARQLVRLPPGAHALEFVAGNIPSSPSDRPRFSLSCAVGNRALFQARPSRAGQGPSRVRSAFTVPADCAWQVLSISIASAQTPDQYPWIAGLAIRPAR